MKISANKYAQLIYESTKGHEKKDVIGILGKIADIISKNSDKNKVGRIISEFERIYNRQEGIVEVKITSMEKISPAKTGQIKRKIAKKFKTDESKIFIENVQDKGIYGGIIIRIGNEIWDGSIANKIEKLRSGLIS